MFPTLDIVIALAFTYLVLSLFCTAINEWIASLLGLRARTLVRAIDRVLRPGERGPIGEATKMVLEYPDVQALAVRPGRVPSYIPAHVFAKAMSDKRISDKVTQRNVDGTGREEWARRFEDTMDRATGWYKREMQLVSFAIAAVLTVLGNADTLMMTRRLWRSPLLRAEFVERARERVAEEHRPVATGYPNLDEPVPPEPVPGERSAEEVEDEPGAALTDHDRELLEGVAGWDEDFRRFNDSLCSRLEAERDGACAEPGPSPQCEAQIARIAAESRCRVDGVHVVSTAGWPGLQVWSGELVSVFARHAPGWLLTIAAISVGAPFWFDTLSRFVNLRGAGKRPEDRRPNGSDQP